MASPAIDDPGGASINDGESDYGSDFSPEEEQIVARLLSGQQIDIEDNPIVTEVEHSDAAQTLRVPRFGTEQKSPLFAAARVAERVAEKISESVVKANGYYPDCRSHLASGVINLTDAEASSEQPDSRACRARSSRSYRPQKVRHSISPRTISNPAQESAFSDGSGVAGMVRITILVYID